MKAVTYSRYGPPEVLRLDDMLRPEPKDGEVLIRVKAAEVTKADCEMRSFKFAVKWFWLPLRLAFGVRRPRRPVLGSYFAGEVVSPTKYPSRFTVGEQVFGCTQMRLGAHAEYICLPETYTVATKPANLSFAEAAAVPLGALNALHFLNKAQLKPGEHLLVIGAGGSIGLFAIQIAKAWGATVTAVDKTSKVDIVQQAGADYFVDYTRQSFAESDQRYDVVFNMVAGGSYTQALAVLKPEGRYVMGNPRLIDMGRAFLTGRGSKRRAYFAFAGETQTELETLGRMLEAGEIHSLVDAIFPMTEAVEAHRRVESEQRNGGIVLDLVGHQS
jgi:NADPH:quinone reductase-like Zn-dependent oxidoreductase